MWFYTFRLKRHIARYIIHKHSHKNLFLLVPLNLSLGFKMEDSSFVLSTFPLHFIRWGLLLAWESSLYRKLNNSLEKFWLIIAYICCYRKGVYFKYPSSPRRDSKEAPCVLNLLATLEPALRACLWNCSLACDGNHNPKSAGSTFYFLCLWGFENTAGPVCNTCHSGRDS